MAQLQRSRESDVDTGLEVFSSGFKGQGDDSCEEKLNFAGDVSFSHDSIDADHFSQPLPTTSTSVATTTAPCNLFSQTSYCILNDQDAFSQDFIGLSNVSNPAQSKLLLEQELYLDYGEYLADLANSENLDVSSENATHKENHFSRDSLDNLAETQGDENEYPLKVQEAHALFLHNKEGEEQLVGGHTKLENRVEIKQSALDSIELTPREKETEKQPIIGHQTDEPQRNRGSSGRPDEGAGDGVDVNMPKLCSKTTPTSDHCTLPSSVTPRNNLMDTTDSSVSSLDILNLENLSTFHSQTGLLSTHHSHQASSQETRGEDVGDESSGEESSSSLDDDSAATRRRPSVLAREPVPVVQTEDAGSSSDSGRALNSVHSSDSKEATIDVTRYMIKIKKPTDGSNKKQEQIVSPVLWQTNDTFELDGEVNASIAACEIEESSQSKQDERGRSDESALDLSHIVEQANLVIADIEQRAPENSEPQTSQQGSYDVHHKEGDVSDIADTTADTSTMAFIDVHDLSVFHSQTAVDRLLKDSDTIDQTLRGSSTEAESLCESSKKDVVQTLAVRQDTSLEVPQSRVRIASDPVPVQDVEIELETVDDISSLFYDSVVSKPCDPGDSKPSGSQHGKDSAMELTGCELMARETLTSSVFSPSVNVDSDKESETTDDPKNVYVTGEDEKGCTKALITKGSVTKDSSKPHQAPVVNEAQASKPVVNYTGAVELPPHTDASHVESSIIPEQDIQKSLGKIYSDYFRNQSDNKNKEHLSNRLREDSPANGSDVIVKHTGYELDLALPGHLEVFGINAENFIACQVKLEALRRQSNFLKPQSKQTSKIPVKINKPQSGKQVNLTHASECRGSGVEKERSLPERHEFDTRTGMNISPSALGPVKQHTCGPTPAQNSCTQHPTGVSRRQTKAPVRAAPRAASALYSMYLRKESTTSFTNESSFQEGLDLSLDISGAKSILFDVEDGVGGGARLGYTSDIDTDDEVEAVRREMREAFGTTCVQSDIRPADLEGSVLPASEAVRQSAEGVVRAPVHTDGDGQDTNDTLTESDRSAGASPATTLASHDRPAADAGLDTPSLATTAPAQHGFASGAFDTVVRAAKPARQQPGPPGPRSQPRGQDSSLGDSSEHTLTEADPRRVHFASLTDTRERMLSGASDQESTVQDQTSMMGEAAELDSMFYKPSAAFSASQMSEVSQAEGLEHSTFNLGELCAQGAGDGAGLGASLASPPSSHATRNHKLPPGNDESALETNDQDDVFAQSKPVKGSEKHFLCEDSPVYINEEGEGVTDLAYHVPLDQVAPNLFDEASFTAVAGVSFGEPAGAQGEAPGELLDFSADEFKSGADCRAVLDADEKENAETERFIQEEAAECSSLGLPDSWTLHSHLQLSGAERPSWLSATEDDAHAAAYSRISVGAFMGSRTEALGSLDGGRCTPRPTFGSRIKTPPSDRRPVLLYQKTPPPLRNIAETLEGEARDSGERAPVRGTGVGSDSETEGTGSQKASGETYSQAKRHSQPRPSDSLQVADDEADDRPLTPEDLVSATPARPASQPAAQPAMSQPARELDLSEITRLITSASSDADSHQLTEMLLKMSQSKKLQQGQLLAATQNAERPRSHAGPSVQDVPRPVDDAPVEPRFNYTRIPADGKSDRNSAKAATTKIGSVDRKAPVSGQEGRQPPGGVESADDSMTAGQARLSPRGGANEARESREGSAERPPSTKRQQTSKIPTQRRQSSAERKPGARGTAGKLATVSTSNSPGVRRMSPQNTDRKPQAVSRESAKHATAPKTHSSEEPVRGGPTTPTNLVLREKDNTSFGSPEHRGHFEADMIGADDDATEWRSPRPSSVFTRSHRDLDSLYDKERPAQPEGESATTAKAVAFTPAPHPASDKSPRDRLSSTPKGSAPIDVTLNSRHSLSHIGSPKDTRRPHVYDDTLISENGVDTFHNKEHYCDYTDADQSTSLRMSHSPVNTRPAGTNTRSVSYTQSGSLPPKAPPTLLTSQRLLDTDFASRYLGGGSGLTERDAWKSATASGPVTGTTRQQLSGQRGCGRTLTSAVDQEASVRMTPELRFAEACCVGLSSHSTLTLYNPTSKWLHVVLRLVALSVDGHSVDTGSILPFVMKEKVIVEPARTEEVKVIFAPRQAGVYVAQVHVVASPVVSDLPLQPDRLPAVCTLEAIAEKPQVQLVTPTQARLLDYGAVPWGCHKGLPLTLLNYSRCSVPVRLVITTNKNSALWTPYSNCFTFERYTAGDVSSISHQSRPSIPALSPSVVNYTLPPAQHTPTQVMLYYVAPPRHLHEGSSGPPEDFTAKVELEVDSPSSLMKLGSVLLRATSGTARLHAPRDMECLRLSAPVGKVQRQTIPLRNAGNIPLEVSLEMTHFPEHFALLPSTVQIEPGGISDVTVAFQPKDSSLDKVNSLLLMTIEPEGPSYEIQVEGAVERAERPRGGGSKPVSAPHLLSDRSLLAWGGVPLGRARQQSFTLKNVAQHMLKLRLEVKANEHECFQLQSVFGKKEKLSTSKEILLKPLETFPVHVLFAPTAIRGFEARLQMRVVGSSVKYTIPLFGYGGISKVIVESAQKGQNSNYWTSVGTPRPGATSVAKVTLRNVGSRAAYVKCLAYADLACKRAVEGARLAVQPEELCVAAGGAREVRVLLQAGDKDALSCADKPCILAALALLYGDELTRQQLRRSVQKYGKSRLKVPDNSLVKDVGFHVPFEDEENIAQEDSVKDTASDVDIFYSTMSKIMLALVGEPEPADPLSRLTQPASSSQTTGQTTSLKNTTALTTISSNKGSAKAPRAELKSAERSTTPVGSRHSGVGEDKVGYSPPVRDTGGGLTAPRRLHYSDAPADTLKQWLLQPDSLVLPAPTPGAEVAVKRLELRNLSAVRGVQFDVSWPAHVLRVSPEHGSVPPRGCAVLAVTPLPPEGTRALALPWSGLLHVTCDNIHQPVKVEVREVAQSDDSLLLPAEPSRALSLVQGTPLTSGETTGASYVSVSTPLHPGMRSLTAAPCSKAPTQQLAFPATSTGKTAEEFMEVRNTSTFPIKWQLSSFTPPYFKGARSEDVLRVTYSVFWLPRHAGIVQPGQCDKVAVCFAPREAGCYSQHWELQTQPQAVAALSATQRTKYEFLAEAVAGTSNPAGIAWSEVIAENTGRSTAAAASHRAESGRDVLEIREERLVFPQTSRNETHICKVQVKNRSSLLHNVTFVKPEPPFAMAHSKVTLKPRHYVRLPVEFHPKKTGHYQGVVICKVDTGQTLTIPVIGQCK